MDLNQELQRLRIENQQLRTNLRHVRLENAIRDQIGSVEAISTLAEYFECTFYSDYLALATIHARANPLRRHTSPLAAVMEPQNPPMEGHSIIYYDAPSIAIVEEICRRQLSPQTECLVFRADKDIGVVLNPRSQYVSDASIACGDYLWELKSRFQGILTELNEALSFESTVTISAIHHGSTCLRLLYEETTHTFEYSWNLPDPIYTYPELCASPMTPQERVEISALEKEFMNDVERLLFFEASLVLDTILKKQFQHAVPLQQITVSTTARLRNVLAILELSTDITASELSEIMELLHLTSAAVSIPELQDRIHDFFVNLSDFSPRGSMKKSTMILDYIENNTQNPALDAQMICDRYRISHTYLSRLIKRETGKGLVDCIHAYRVKAAKPLLSDTSLSVEQVAVQVGFSNRYGLIRAFRNLENCTPSEYRTQHRTST